MRGKRFSIGLTATLAIFAVTLLVAGTRAVAQVKILHNFGSGKDGVSPYDKLIFDAAGNLYGTTDAGGAYGGGAVFELSPKAGGGWTEKVLHNFGSSKDDGGSPFASLIFDAGNLYGTTLLGGAYRSGTVFELTPKAGGGWTEKVLHSFSPNGGDGYNPTASLIFDAAGNLYGTTNVGGAYRYGTVFELTPKAGSWTEKVLHSFNDNGKDGLSPYAGLIFDKAGNLYGTTGRGGANGYGTVFELTPKAGSWTEKALHSFNDTDGYDPYAGLIFDSAGNLFGTTWGGGAHHVGTVFELTPKAGGGWTEKVLHSFNDNGTDGNTPYASLIFDAVGNLYGTTYFGGTIYPGCGDGCGTVFELTPKAGSWTEKVLHSFGSGKDGVGPYAGLISDKAGNLYGTTFYGGTNLHGGTVFEIKP